MSTVLIVVVLEAECFLLEYLRFWLRQPNLEFFTFCQPIAQSILCNRQPIARSTDKVAPFNCTLEVKGASSASIQACALI